MTFYRLLLAVFSTLLFCSGSWAADTPCPRSYQESKNNSCEQEQGWVKKALTDLQPSSMRTYCAKNPGKTYACRALVRFEDSQGNLSEDIFEEWFITDPRVTPVKQWRGFYLKRPDNLFDIYWVDEFEGTWLDDFQITSADPMQTNMAVVFNDGYPSFDIHYNFVDKSKQAVRGFYTYFPESVQIDKYNREKNGQKTPIETLYYQFVSKEIP